MPQLDPWREVEFDASLHLVWRELPEQTGGAALVTAGSVAIVYLDPRMDAHERTCALAHELAHRQRGHIRWSDMPATWRAIVARDEAACDRHAAARLVPVEDLSAWMDETLVDVEVGVGPDDVAAAWGVTRRIAEAALDNLTRWERVR